MTQSNTKIAIDVTKLIPPKTLVIDKLSWVQFSRGASHQNYAAI